MFTMRSKVLKGSTSDKTSLRQFEIGNTLRFSIYDEKVCLIFFQCVSKRTAMNFQNFVDNFLF